MAEKQKEAKTIGKKIRKDEAEYNAEKIPETVAGKYAID